MKVKVEIKDTGIGMSKEYLPTLFEPFSREQDRADVTGNL
ncbi:ATP-binding protein [Clostridium sp. OF09-10]|mgnify:FL=1|nr:ATP-binding protein [Clostridium sp. OF09-10]